MGSTRRSFTDEYKLEAVSLVVDGGRSVAEVAGNIGASTTTLGNWVKKAKEAGAPGPEKLLSVSERDELERLRDENAHLRLQVAFAKKVATWFAKDQR